MGKQIITGKNPSPSAPEIPAPEPSEPPIKETRPSLLEMRRPTSVKINDTHEIKTDELRERLYMYSKSHRLSAKKNSQRGLWCSELPTGLLGGITSIMGFAFLGSGQAPQWFTGINAGLNAVIFILALCGRLLKFNERTAKHLSLSKDYTKLYRRLEKTDVLKTSDEELETIVRDIYHDLERIDDTAFVSQKVLKKIKSETDSMRSPDLV